MKTIYGIRNGKVVDITNEPLQKDTKPFYINTGTGLRWRNTSANKTWIEGGKIKRQKKGRDIK
tara:strand:- start:1159 stop:1347 length:189 start_codon:yes stop_codon:yes gene_type:complete